MNKSKIITLFAISICVLFGCLSLVAPFIACMMFTIFYIIFGFVGHFIIRDRVSLVPAIFGIYTRVKSVKFSNNYYVYFENHKCHVYVDRWLMLEHLGDYYLNDYDENQIQLDAIKVNTERIITDDIQKTMQMKSKKLAKKERKSYHGWDGALDKATERDEKINKIFKIF